MEKPWCNCELPSDKVDEALFATSTQVHVHNGYMTKQFEKQGKVLLNLGMESLLAPLVLQILHLTNVTKQNLDNWLVTNEGMAESIFLSIAKIWKWCPTSFFIVQ
jgi:hypothetical protein